MVRSFFYLPGLRARSGKFFLSGCAGPARLVNFFSSSCGLAPGRKKSLYYMLFFLSDPGTRRAQIFFIWRSSDPDPAQEKIVLIL